jgi:hypothetical protein
MDTPEAVVERAVAHGFAAIAITDHDTLRGLEEADTAARRAEMEFLPGTEVSAHFAGFEVHIVGLGIQADGPLIEALDRLRKGRAERAQRIIERLRASGINVDPERIAGRAAGDASIGRIHIALEIRTMGLVKSVQGAFDKYLGEGRPAYEPNPRLPCDEAIRLIQAAGGLAFLAHPGIGAPRRHFTRLLELPFDGIEAYHSKHSPGQIDQFLSVARERELLVSGGSDCHGTLKTKPDMGKVRVPYGYYQRIQDVLAHRKWA